ncbi:MAG TPA: NADH-quinone oxidoreductase subunit NuoH [Candidatus Ruania gallistercoris]|uniref:NADH-quinone oxidoreductase subunit H n=1 Tax=Candidatus Ruania gallistercoris TaxID=2838746 RepID=A0A9D2EEU9_9MICO|nr:NADH-quinone oxidoreductase subunit NuoH [Candidatus Ruania gallistercoris]
MNPPVLATEGGADFSGDSLGLVVIKAAAILVFLLLSVLFALWFERRIIGRFQERLGPNVRGPFGLVQSIPDALKLLLKEDITVKAADKLIYKLAPLISVFCAFMIFAIIPFGPEVQIPGTDIITPLQLTDLPVAVLYILAITGLGVYGIVLGGWSSGSTYPLLGAVRSTAQVLSYELSMSLALVSVLLVSGSMSTSEIVDAQTQMWWSVALLPAFVIYVISMLGETNRLPFDLPEAEGELVGGYNTEYSSMKFAWFFLAEYINMLNASAIATTLFLGGWRAPWPISAINDGMFNEGWWPVLWFMLKLWLVMFFFVWVRATLLRFRYDQFMNLGWKVLIPVALAWVVGVGVIQGVRQFSDISLQTLLFVLAGVLIVFAVVLMLLPEKKDEAAADAGTSRAAGAVTARTGAKPAAGSGAKAGATTRSGPKAGSRASAKPAEKSEPFDAFADGYPVPPLPGQTLPPSPRRAKVTAPAGASASEEENSDG